MQFKSKINKFLYFLILTLICILSFNAILNFINGLTFLLTNDATQIRGYLISFMILTSTSSLLIWIIRSTSYIIQNDFLECKAGSFKVKILISKIRKIEQNNSFLKFTTFKPALTYKEYYI